MHFWKLSCTNMPGADRTDAAPEAPVALGFNSNEPLGDGHAVVPTGVLPCVCVIDTTGATDSEPLGVSVGSPSPLFSLRASTVQ